MVAHHLDCIGAYLPRKQCLFEIQKFPIDNGLLGVDYTSAIGFRASVPRLRCPKIFPQVFNFSGPGTLLMSGNNWASTRESGSPDDTGYATMGPGATGGPGH